MRLRLLIPVTALLTLAGCDSGTKPPVAPAAKPAAQNGTAVPGSSTLTFPPGAPLPAQPNAVADAAAPAGTVQPQVQTAANCCCVPATKPVCPPAAAPEPRVTPERVVHREPAPRPRPHRYARRPEPKPHRAPPRYNAYVEERRVERDYARPPQGYVAREERHEERVEERYEERGYAGGYRPAPPPAYVAPRPPVVAHGGQTYERYEERGYGYRPAPPAYAPPAYVPRPAPPVYVAPRPAPPVYVAPPPPRVIYGQAERRESYSERESYAQHSEAYVSGGHSASVGCGGCRASVGAAGRDQNGFLTWPGKVPARP